MKPLFVLALLAACSVAGAGLAQDPRRTLVVTGSADVAAQPDVGTISAGVQTTGATAGEAMAANAALMDQVFAALAEAGVEEGDYRTSNFNLDQIWEDGGTPRDGLPKIVGYRADNTVTIRVRDIDRFGALIDALGAAGANRFYSIGFSVDDPEPLLDQARTQAVADARRKAELYAAAAGVTLGPVLTIREPGGGFAPAPFAARAEMAMDTPIAAGTVQMSASVEIIYAIE